jgi:hypothetical protein
MALAVRLSFALATLLASGALAHGWEELDTRHVLERADAIVAVAELAQDAWTVDPAAAPDPVGAPPELRWWTWVTSRVVDGGDADVVAAIERVAPQWLGDQEPADVVLDWTEALGELVAHAAARDVEPDEREAAAEALSRPDLDPAEAQAASWLVLLPTLSEAERRDLAPIFARLDALIDAVAR